MRVLDVGCGVGDVSLLAARLVGADGAVLGFDRSKSSIDTARRRATALRAGNVNFTEADLVSFEPDRLYDAVVGRLVLLYVPDAATKVCRLSQFLRPGGVVAFQEIDMPQLAQAPESDLFRQVKRWITQAFAAAGAEVEMGSKLYSTFLRAGLNRPNMISAARVGCGPDSAAYKYLAGVVRSLAPVIERSNIANLSDIDIDTLAHRLRDDAVSHERVIFLPRMVGAWARIAEAV